MPNDRPSRWLMTTDELAARLGKPDVAVVDGSFYLPALKRAARAEYIAGQSFLGDLGILIRTVTAGGQRSSALK